MQTTTNNNTNDPVEYLKKNFSAWNELPRGNVVNAKNLFKNLGLQKATSCKATDKRTRRLFLPNKLSLISEFLPEQATRYGFHGFDLVLFKDQQRLSNCVLKNDYDRVSVLNTNKTNLTIVTEFKHAGFIKDPYLLNIITTLIDKDANPLTLQHLDIKYGGNVEKMFERQEKNKLHENSNDFDESRSLSHKGLNDGFISDEAALAYALYHIKDDGFAEFWKSCTEKRPKIASRIMSDPLILYRIIKSERLKGRNVIPLIEIMGQNIYQNIEDYELERLKSSIKSLKDLNSLK